MDTLISISELIVGRGFSVVYLPNATREGFVKRRNNDLIVIDALRQMGVSGHFADFDLDTSSIQQLLSRTTLLITSRFHGMVAGLSLGIPTGVIGWGHKYREVLTEFDLAEFAADYRSDLADVSSMVSKLMESADEIRQKIATALPAVRTSSNVQFAELNSLLAEISKTR